MKRPIGAGIIFGGDLVHVFAIIVQSIYELFYTGTRLPPAPHCSNGNVCETQAGLVDTGYIALSRTCIWGCEVNGF